MLITYLIYNYITYRFNYVYADLSKTCNVCMHSWLYELNINNYYIILLDPFLRLYTSCMQTWQGFIQRRGGRGAPWDFHPQKAMF